MTISIALLGSTRGTNLIALYDAIQQRRLSAQIKLVVSNKKDAMILERSKSYQLPTQFLDSTNKSPAEYDRELSQLLTNESVDLVVLIGYMRILTTEFTETWRNKVINIHPSLLPAYGGKMDLAVHRAVLAAGEEISGCTVHYVNEQLDAGPIILQKRCEVYKTDTPESLKERVQALEGEALIEAINSIAVATSIVPSSSFRWDDDTGWDDNGYDKYS